MSEARSQSRRVVFLHPDLGIGGAERLVVDAALALKHKGHKVEFVTAHHDPSHCFPETSDGTLLVTAVGDWLPRSILGYCYALCAYFRMIWASVYLVLFSRMNPDIIFCDQISACIPFLKLFSSAYVVFYCHFPDQLLTQRISSLKKLYRAPIDWVEEATTGMADVVLVNSQFTGRTFKNTFKRLCVQPRVLYPSLNMCQFDVSVSKQRKNWEQITFLSINRYERKKNLALALQAFAALKTKISGAKIPTLKLIIAGGYDPRVTENIEYYKELVEERTRLGLGANEVDFRKSLSNDEKLQMLCECHCLLYTPAGEHFGIVPLEAMYCRLPVIAVNDGGPTETVVDQTTGYLVAQTPKAFADAMLQFTSDSRRELIEQLGNNGHERVIKNFSFEAFAQKLENVILKVEDKKQS